MAHDPPISRSERTTCFLFVVAKNNNCRHSLTAISCRLARTVNESDATDVVTALYDRWYMVLVRYALRTTANYELAEDLAQDAFMQFYQALRVGKDIQHPKAWTICVLRRAMNRQMKDRNLQEQLDEMDMPGKSMPAISKFAEIRSLLSVLSPREEEVLLLRLEALKYREIADQLGISINSVNTLLARALRKLQAAVSEMTNQERENENANHPVTRAS